MDNLIRVMRDPALLDTGAGAGAASGASDAAGATAGAGQAWKWKSNLRTDLRESPLSTKFDDTPDGLNKMTESYANLEKLLGHEKVPIPKDSNDLEGWARFSKAMGIPDTPEGYALPDATLPESMKGMTMDKATFSKFMHEQRVHPTAVKGLWEAYQKTNTVNALKSEWGAAYQGNVELGQMVINKFSDDKETNDYLTAVLSQDPRGVKFLAKIGSNFAENKIGEFQAGRFSLSPEQAQEEITKMKQDLNGPYMNMGDKHTAREHNIAVERMNSLIASIQKARQG